MSRGGVSDNATLERIVGHSEIANLGNSLTEIVGNEPLETTAKTLSGGMNELKKSVSDGKKKVAEAITGIGVATPADADFATMATNITTAGANAGSNGYANGYNKGVTDADNRANVNSVNYKTGYNKGVADADNRTNTSSANYKAGYNAGKKAVPSFYGYSTNEVAFDFDNIESVYVSSGSFVMYGGNSLSSTSNGQGTYSAPITVTKSFSGYRYIKLTGTITFSVSPKK